MTIGQRVFVTVFATLIFLVAAFLVGERYAFRNSFLNYTAASTSERLDPLRDELAKAYLEHQDWSFIRGQQEWPSDYIRLLLPFRLPPDSTFSREEFSRNRKFFSEQAEAGQSRGFGGPSGFRMGQFRPPFETLSLIDAQGEWVAGAALSDKVVRVKINSGDEVVGYLALAVPTEISSELDLAFFNQQVRMAVIMGIFALGVAAIAAGLLSRSFSKPIRDLAVSVNRLARGDYEASIETQSKDEIGQLTDDFNSLAGTLKQTRASQRAWVADTSHELRTPLTILRAELEAVQDGLRPLDQTALASVGAELRRLEMLVDDLHQLSASDAGKFQLSPVEFDLGEVVRDGVGVFGPKFQHANISLTGLGNGDAAAARPALLVGDKDRIRQVVDNLLENSLRYTDAGGELRISLDQTSERVTLAFEDSAPGVSDQDLSRLFDRFYRADPSRNRSTGASGLGLAICDSIMTAHGGEIAVSASAIGGLCVSLTFPRNGLRGPL